MIVFQDFDGVLNSENFFQKWMKENCRSSNDYEEVRRIFQKKFCGEGMFRGFLQPDLVEKFNNFIYKNNIDIICSSSWRLGCNLSQMKKLYEHRGLPYDRLIGLTPDLYGRYAYVSRDNEIKACIQENHLENEWTMSIDDCKVYESEYLPKFKPFTTDFDFGLTDEILQGMQSWVDISKVR